MASSAAVDKFLHAIETATIPDCDAWSADATTVMCGGRWRAALLADMAAAGA